MVKQSPSPEATLDRLDDVFGALSDRSRRAIVARLATGPASITELAEPLPMSMPAVLKHVHVLEGAGLVAHRKDGRTRYCRLVPAPLAAADDWLVPYRTFWEGRLDALAAHFASGGR